MLPYQSAGDLGYDDASDVSSDDGHEDDSEPCVDVGQNSSCSVMNRPDCERVWDVDVDVAGVDDVDDDATDVFSSFCIIAWLGMSTDADV